MKNRITLTPDGGASLTLLALIGATLLLLGLGACSPPPTAPDSTEPIGRLEWKNVPRVICESGSEFREASREGDPYYVHTLPCTMNDANGKPVWVVVID